MEALFDVSYLQDSVFFRGFLTLVILFSLMISPTQTTARAAGNNCLTSTPPSGSYTVTVCITAPADGATVSGVQTVSATVSTTGATPGVAKLIFYLNWQYLITDYQNPYSFALPTTKWVDGSYALAVSALMKDGYTSQPSSSITVTFNNGITTPPVNTNTFTPTSGTTPSSGQPFILAAAGDGADGATNAGNVTNQVAAWNPNLFLYLGDVYEKGSSTEFYNWYGSSSTFYGRFRSITDPIIGNHEYENGVAPGYFDYWNNVPNYYSYDAAGWHFIALNSNCGLIQNCAVGQAQYQWLLNDLNTHNNVCTIAYFHHPVFNVGPEGYTTTMNDMWQLMAQKGVDIVLTGHDHDYQRWTPLDGNGNPSPAGITEFVAGGGGHGTQQFVVTDNRMVVGFDTSPNTFGALRLALNQYGASFQYINYQGTILDSGAIPCSGAPTDPTAPTAPTNLTATTSSATRADLSWGSSTDNVGVAGYDIYRNGILLTSLGVVNNYTDTSLALGTTYSYQVKARDAAGNLSSFSNTATITTPLLLFSDGFESGNLSAWTSNTNLVVQQQEVYAGTYAVRATSTGSAASYASKTLSTTYSDLYYSVRFKIISKSSTTSAYVQRFRTATDGAIGGVLISSTNKLGYRNDVVATSNTTGPVVTLGVWHQVQTHLQINGTSSKIEIWYDGVLVNALSTTENFGTNPIGRINVGDRQTSDIYDMVLDEVGVNTSFIDTSDSQSPSTPTGVTANATAPNAVHLTWNASTDNINVTGYDLFRNGSLLATVGTTTSYDDTPLSPSFTYQYQVRARDAAGNTSALSTAASVTTPADTAAPSVNLTAPADGATVNANVTISADANDNVGISRVDFLVNGTVVGTSDIEGGPYSILWNSSTVPDGTVTITARAVDGSGNATNSSSKTINVFNAAGDTTPPTIPTNFTAVAGGSSRADLAWNASTDNVGVVAYDIYRDNTFLASVGVVTNYSDSTVLQGATYQYKIQARDAAGNVSGFTSAVSVTIPAPLFYDGFESGNLSSWTNSGLAIQQQGVLEGSYSAEAVSTAGTASYATRTLTAQNDLYYLTWFKVLNQGASSVFLQRFRTSANGAILGTFVSSTGKLGYRNDVTGATVTSTTSVSSGAWHQIQTHVRINGTSSQVDVWLDGAQVTGLSNTESLGSNPIGIVQLGENSTGKNYDVLFDELTFDTSFVRSATAPYTSIDSGPLGTVATSAASFSFSSTATGATFECSLDNAAFSACTSPQNITALADGAHTFAVRSTDPLGNVDSTPASRSWTVDTTAPTVISTTPADTATDLPLATTVVAIFSESMNPASITTSSFILSKQSDGTLVTATISYDPATNKATLQPSAALSYLTTYVATAKGGTSGVKDAVGNSLASDVTWSFTTTPPDTTPPTVTFLAPADGSSVAGTVTLSADAVDNIAVDHVDFLVNNTVVGTATSAPYSVNWNSTMVPNGAASVVAHAVDTSSNVADATINVTVANDVTPPSAPTNLAATSVTSSRIDLTWTASTDNVGVTGYDIYRNGALLTSVGAVTTYSDGTAGLGSTYQYQVFAKDAAGNVSAASNTASATTQAALFSDNFETGDLSLWTSVSGLTVQQQEVLAGLYAARATSNGSAVANAYSQLSAVQYDLYFDTSFKILSQDPSNSVYLLRFRTADTQSLLGVFVSPTGKLGYRNDLSGASNTSTVNISQGTWHEVQTHVHVDSAGGSGLVEVWFDGTQVLSQAEALGNAPVARLQIGESTLGRSYDIAFDNVLAATSYINPGDTTAPSAPANLTATASDATRVDLTWSAAIDNVGVTNYLIYRNGTLLTTTGAVTTYSDTTTAPQTAYQYQVRARDAAGNISALSDPASVTTPADTTPPTASLTAPTNGALLSGPVTLSANASDNVGVDHVDFMVNNNVVGTDNSAPYSITWNSTAVADGATTIAARAVDGSNNAGVSANTNVTVDNTPPDTTITAQPPALTASTSASFSFASTEANGTFACSLDGSTFNACSSPQAYTALSNGSHTFQVRATDAAGNTDPSPAAGIWTVDTTAPTVTSTTPANRASSVPPTNPVSAVFSEAMNSTTITTTTFFMKPKNSSTVVAATVAYDSTTQKATLQPTAPLSSQTTYNITIKGGISGVKDLVGNALSKDYTWSFTTGTLDTTPPSVSLTAPTNGATITGTVTLSATASDNVAVAYVDFLVNGSVVGSDSTSPYSISWNSTTIADGSATVTACAADSSSNATTSTAATVTVSNSTPDTTITSGPSGTVNSTSASFGFTSTISGSTFQCSLDGSTFNSCTSPQAYSGLTNGSHTFQVRAIYSGSVDSTPASRTWTVDTIAPTGVAITAPTNGASVTGQVTISASASDNVGVTSVSFYVDGQLLATDTSAPFSVTWNTNKASKTTHTLYVRAADAAGNTTQSANITVTVR